MRVVAGLEGRRPTIRWSRGEWLAEVDPGERMGRLAVAVLHELSHRLLVRHGLPNDERHAWWLTAARLLPRTPYLRELRRTGGAVDELATVFPDASHEMLARRQVQLADSLHLWVWDVAPTWRRYRVLSPGWRWRTRSPNSVELEALELALETRSPVQPIGGVRAWPVIDGAYHRVLCVADGEVLLSTSASS